MGRHSKARSRDNLSAVVSPRQKHSQTSLQILDDVSNRYYREVEAIAVQSAKEKDHSILRHQQHDMIVQTSLYNTDDSSTSTITAPPQPPQRPTQSTATTICISSAVTGYVMIKARICFRDK
ncbi:hypothetical protein GQX74_007818 [Glossina fuscipes]|nr:hypothetical protein GQX74_007818 [Glossina fuscipes]